MVKSMDNSCKNSKQNDPISSALTLTQQRERETFSMERKTANGNYVAFACGPLKRPRYINERIE